MTTTEAKEIMSKMSRLAAELIEHGDGVVILFCFMDQDDNGRFSRLMSSARGNHYLRLGMAYDYAKNMVEGNLAKDDECGADWTNDQEE